MKKQSLNLSSLLICFLILSSCSSIPKNTADGCSIFSERYLSLNIEQLFDVFLGIDEHAEISKNKIKNIIFLFKVT